MKDVKKLAERFKRDYEKLCKKYDREKVFYNKSTGTEIGVISINSDIFFVVHCYDGCSNVRISKGDTFKPDTHKMTLY